jgi:DNA polymerase-3 subunit gamma/tau
MSYQVLARKWRPQSFDELIGQEPIVVALGNALREGRIAQAYLFSGIRGVGKTTAARLLAKALNCESGPTPTPCNECPPCREIAQGADMDVVEVDAATYSKVEQIRDLTESLKYSPARDRYKVVVLDEVHRLSRQAFDALLKIVEEPPAHLVFLFATTEIDAVPATILSRCQEFHFRRVPAPAMVAHLHNIATAEDIEASDTALRLIARAGEGSVRDAVALLDQLATFGGGSIPEGEAIRLLGGLDTGFFRDLLAAITEGRSPDIVSLAARVEEEGWDPRQVYPQFLAYCRDGLHLSLGGSPEQLDLPQEDAASLAELARHSGYENLLRLLQHLLTSEVAVRRSEEASLALEIAWLRASELPKLTRIEELLAGGRDTSSAPTPRATAPQPAPRPEPRPAPPKAAPREVRTMATAPPQPAPAPQPAESPQTTDPVQALLDTLHRLKPSLAVRLESAGLKIADGQLEISLPMKEASRFRATLERGSNRDEFDGALASILGSEARWILRETQPAPVVEKEEASESAEALDDPTVQTVLDLFGGKIESVDD